MCLIAIAYRVHPRYPLIIAANRDEFLERPTAPMHYWADAPNILAGRDLKAGGTWSGITRNGRFAAITNYRDFNRKVKNGPSRGLLVRTALENPILPADTSELDGFNLIYGHWEELYYHNNITGHDVPLKPGIHGLSNALLNTPWPKVVRAKAAMERIISSPDPQINDLFELLADGTPAEESLLPDTGIGLDWEKKLSSVRIIMDGYGTRCSTVVLIDHNGMARLEERTLMMGSEVDHVAYTVDLGS